MSFPPAKHERHEPQHDEINRGIFGRVVRQSIIARPFFSLRGGGAGTSSRRSRGANRSNRREVGRRVSLGRSCHVRQRTWSSVATCGKICRRVIVQSLHQGKKMSGARKNHDVPCPSELSDPKRQASVPKNVAMARVSGSAERGTSENFQFWWSHFLGRMGTWHRKHLSCIEVS